MSHLFPTRTCTDARCLLRMVLTIITVGDCVDMRQGCLYWERPECNCDSCWHKVTYLVDIVGRVLLNISHPVPDVVEGGLICNIVYQQNPHGSTIVSCTAVIRSCISKQARREALSRKRTAFNVNKPACTAAYSPLVIVLNLSWPAVSHICSLIHLLSMRIFFILKSILRATASKDYFVPLL